jgi:tRNA threonylcarbamoyladenosine biosynthesis protein TsaB
MIVLGLDTATSSTAVALRLADGSVSEARDDPAAGEHPGHATRLLAMAQELLSDAGVSWREVQRIAVGVGPGTFTGLRVGVATARGLAQSLSAELVGVSSLAALADVALEEQALADSESAAVLAVIDARRGEVFAAAFQRHAQEPPQALLPTQALAPQDLADVRAQVEGDGVARARRWLAVGDGALRYRDSLEAAGIPMPAEDSPLHTVSAAAICRLASLSTAAGSWQDVLPDYQRQPDAELALKAVSGQGI